MAKGRPPSGKYRTRASGSLATFALRTILLVASTTHTLLSSNYTSLLASGQITMRKVNGRQTWARRLPLLSPLTSLLRPANYHPAGDVPLKLLPHNSLRHPGGCSHIH